MAAMTSLMTDVLPLVAQIQQRVQAAEQARLRELQRQQREQQRALEAAREQARRFALLGHRQALEDRQLRDRQDEDLRTHAADVDTRLAQLQAAAEADERRRRQALWRTVARARASFGARGLTAADTMGEALLLGLVDDTRTDQREAETLHGLRTRALADELAARRRRNLLELSQLYDRQRPELLGVYA